MSTFRLARFSADVSPPVGHPLCGGWITPVVDIVDPQQAHGLVLLGPDQPLVLCALDWCELRNEAFDLWRDSLAEAAGTAPERVIVATVHQHDAPLMDIRAQQRLDQRGLGEVTCDVAFNQDAADRTAAALRASLSAAVPVDGLALGRARVDRVASNRRLLGDDGKVRFFRGSGCKDPAVRAWPEGVIDPYLTLLGFLEGDRPVALVYNYAVHPMSHYGQGHVSCDFCGLARELRRAELPEAAHLYFSGGAGNLGAGKYNDATPECRPILRDRVHAGMVAAWDNAHRHPLSRADFRLEKLRLAPKDEDGFRRAEMEATLADRQATVHDVARAAMVLNYLDRWDAGHAIDLPAIDFGPAQVVQLPGEPFIEYQLLAQELRPDQTVVTIGYGDNGPGYLPLAESYPQGGYEPGKWCFVAPSCEAELRRAMGAVMGG